MSNKNLKRCSHEEKGVWIDVLCLLHDSEEYGVLRWPLADIARAVNARVEVLVSLCKKSVIKGKPGVEDVELLVPPMVPMGRTNGDTNYITDGSTTGKPVGGTNHLPFIYQSFHAGKKGKPVTLIHDQDGPIWFSSRMVEDEYLRVKRGANGHKALSHPNHPANKSLEAKNVSPLVTNGETNHNTSVVTLPPTNGATPSSSSSSSEVLITPSGKFTNSGKQEIPKSGDLNLGGAQSEKSTDSNGAKSAPSPRGSRLPSDWVLPKAWGEWALQNRQDWIADDVRRVATIFRNYWVAKTGRDATKLDWEATWQNWVMKEPRIRNRHADLPQADRHLSTAGQQTAAAAKRLLERDGGES